MRERDEFYQSIFGFVLVEGTDSCPVVISHDGQPRRVELVVGGNDAEKVGKRLLREHRVGVGVSQLENKARSFKKASRNRDPQAHHIQ